MNPYLSLALSITALLLSIASVVLSVVNSRRNRR
jgi:hypothetical protein